MKSSNECSINSIYYGLCLFMLFLIAFSMYVNNLEHRNTYSTIIIMKYAAVENADIISSTYTSDTFKRNNTNYYVAKLNNKINNKSTSTLVKASANNIPLNYTEINSPLLDVPIYAFVDQEGKTQYRLCVERKNNNTVEYGFIKTLQRIVNLNIQYEYDINSEFIDTEKENYGTITPEVAPDDKIQDLISGFGYTGLYYKTNNGLKEYYIYGHYKNNKSAFYLADENGNMIPGTLPVEIR